MKKIGFNLYYNESKNVLNKRSAYILNNYLELEAIRDNLEFEFESEFEIKNVLIDFNQPAEANDYSFFKLDGVYYAILNDNL